MVTFTCTTHVDAEAGVYRLLEVEAADVLPDRSWQGQKKPEGMRRYILPAILVEDEALEHLAEADSKTITFRGLIEESESLTRIYSNICAQHDAKVALITRHYELPHDIWHENTGVIGPCEFHLAYRSFLLMAEHGRYTIRREPSTPAELQTTISNALKAMTGTRLSEIRRCNPFNSAAATPVACWAIKRLRPYAAKRYEAWISKSVSDGYMSDPLKFGEADIEAHIEKVTFRYSRERLTCNILTPTGDVISEESLTIRHPILGHDATTLVVGMKASDLSPHASLADRCITGIGHMTSYTNFTLDQRHDRPLPLKVEPAAFPDDIADQETERLLGAFCEVSPFARAYAMTLEPSERISRISRVALRRLSETPCQDVSVKSVRFVLHGDVLDIDGEIAKGVFCHKGALRIENLPETTMLAAVKTARGRPLSDLVSMNGLEGLVITQAARIPPGKRRPDQLLLRAA